MPSWCHCHVSDAVCPPERQKYIVLKLHQSLACVVTKTLLIVYLVFHKSKADMEMHIFWNKVLWKKYEQSLYLPVVDSFWMNNFNLKNLMING